MRKFLTIACVFAAGLIGAASANAASDAWQPKEVQWSFDGIFGKVDRQSAQRGFQVYQEVCAACHALSGLSYRNLMDIGFSEAEVKTLAAEKTVMDGPNEDGEMFERPARPSDKFVPPYANEQASRVANAGAYPPDLTLMAKARPNGANYLYSLLMGYQDAPAGFEIGEGLYYNPYFPGKKIAMAAPLFDGGLSYGDGTDASTSQMAHDVVNFLQWTAEPEMEQRKSMGLKVLLYLFIATLLLYAAKRITWRDVS